MRFLFLIVGLIFFNACSFKKEQVMSFEEVDYKILNEWIYAFNVQGIKNNNEVILRPPGVEQLIMELTLPHEGGVSFKKHCVYYSVPYKEHRGTLKIEEQKSVEACAENSGNNELFVALNPIDGLKISWSQYRLELNFFYQKKNQKIIVPIYNFTEGNIHEKYWAKKEKRLYTNLSLMKINENSFEHINNRYLGKLADRFSKSSAIRCHQVDKDCNTVGENRCDECRYGWYEVVDFNCPGGGSKFCGQNHCGEKNEPACPRGVRVVDNEEKGICQSDLEPVENADKILICQ